MEIGKISLAEVSRRCRRRARGTGEKVKEAKEEEKEGGGRHGGTRGTSGGHGFLGIDVPARRYRARKLPYLEFS